MATQGINYIVTLNSQQVVTGFGRMESSAMAFERSVAGVNSTLQGLGVYLGAKELFGLGKKFVEAAADYETSMLRIKNASSDVAEGVKNQLFIQDEVDKFKIGLQESADGWGKFLLRIKNAGLDGDTQRRLHDNILTVSKVAALPASEMEATVRNVGIMLGEGILEARHLRGLSYTHPQLVPFLADAMGLKSGQKDEFSKILHGDHDDATAMQKIALLMSSGKLTKMAIDSKVILDAFEKYRKSVEVGLPETLTTIQSGLNEISTEWLKFQSELVGKARPELNALFDTFKDGIKWVRANEEALLKWGGVIVHVGEFWIKYRATMLLVNAASAAYNGFLAGYTGLATAQTTAIGGQVAAMNALVAATERLVYVQAQAAGMPTLAAMSAANAAKYSMGAAGAGVGVAGGAAAGAGASIAAFASGAAIFLLAVGEFKKYNDSRADREYERAHGLEKYEVNKRREIWDEFINNVKEWQDRIAKTGGYVPVIDEKGNLKHVGVGAPIDTDLHPTMPGEAAWGRKQDAKDTAGLDALKTQHATKFVPKEDHITGQRVISIITNIYGGLNGQKIDKQIIEKKGDVNMSDIMNEVAKGLQSVVNGAQRSGND